MKRRNFLTAAGTVGIIGAASSATLASSVYNSISKNILLEEFDAPSIKALDKFASDISENMGSLNLNDNFAQRFTTPTHIVEKNKNSIVFKNKAGQTVSIATKHGKKEIKVF